MPRLIWLFSFVNLVLGSAAFVIGGIVGPLARDLNVSVPTAGQAMTAYALASALLAPLAMLVTAAWPRKRALVVSLAVFLVGNVICALASDITTLYVGRAIMGVGAVFTPLAAGMAVAMVLPAQRGRALSFVFLGMSLSYVVGVPLGAWLADAYRWQVPIVALSGALTFCVAALIWLVPAKLEAPTAAFAGAGALMVRRDVRAVLLTTLLYFVAIFIVFSYIGPVLQALVPMSRSQQAATLAGFGLAGVVGTLVGGWANDRFGPRRTMVTGLLGLGASMVMLPWTAGAWHLLMPVLLVWGASGFSLMAPQQSRIATLSPAHAPLLLSLNASMVYLGTALGAIVGGAAVARLGLTHLALAGLPFIASALAMLWFGPHSEQVSKAASIAAPAIENP